MGDGPNPEEGPQPAQFETNFTPKRISKRPLRYEPLLAVFFLITVNEEEFLRLIAEGSSGRKLKTLSNDLVKIVNRMEGQCQAISALICVGPTSCSGEEQWREGFA